jgi:hypothetical protein
MKKKLIITHKGVELYNFTFAIKDWEPSPFGTPKDQYNDIFKEYVDDLGFDPAYDTFGDIETLIMDGEIDWDEVIIKIGWSK